jgi:hypothetical protein
MLCKRLSLAYEWIDSVLDERRPHEGLRYAE